MLSILKYKTVFIKKKLPKKLIFKPLLLYCNVTVLKCRTAFTRTCETVVCKVNENKIDLARGKCNQ